MSRREQLIVVVLVAAAALAGFWFGLLSPKVHEAKQLGDTLVAAQTHRTQALAAVATAQASQASYVSNVTTIDSLTPAIPPVDTTSSLLREIDSAARKAHVDFNAISLASSGGGSAPPSASAATASPLARVPAPPVPPGYAATSSAGIPTVGYSLTFVGGYLKLQKFLAAMQHFVKVHKGSITARGRLIDVSGITLAGGTVSMNVTAYLLSPADQMPLPVPRNAPVVPTGAQPAAAPGSPASPKTAAVAASPGRNS
jgi:hypothetical protein